MKYFEYVEYHLCMNHGNLAYNTMLHNKQGCEAAS